MKILFLMTVQFLLIISAALAADPVPYTVYFRAGKKLIRLDNNHEYFVPKGIYVKVLELDPKRRDQFYVYDKSGKAVYITDAQDLVEIAEDIRLLPDLNAEKVYPPKSVFRSENKSANFDSQFSVHFDNLGLRSLNEIYADDIDSVLSTRYEARTIYLSDLPFHFGLSLNYQSAYWKNDIEEVKISILSFGPVFQYNIVNDDDLKIKALMSAETAPIYTGISANNKDYFSALLFDVGLESEWGTPLGVFSLGGHFRHHELKLKSTTRTNISLPPKEYGLNSFGATIGYKYEWSL
jgi:hypothetical protein